MTALPEVLERAVAGREPVLRAALIELRGFHLLRGEFLQAAAAALTYCPDREAVHDLLQRTALLQFDPHAFDEVRRVNKQRGWEPTGESIGRLLCGWARREFCARAGTRPRRHRRASSTGGVA